MFTAKRRIRQAKEPNQVRRLMDTHNLELCGHPERIKAFQRGDRELLGSLYQHYRKDVHKVLTHGFTFSSSGKTIRFQGFQDPFKSQEVLQECFLRAFKDSARQSYNPSKPWRPYLMAIVRSQVIDYFRKQTTEQRYFVALQDAVSGAEHEHDALERIQQESNAGALSPDEVALRGKVQQALDTFFKTLSSDELLLVHEHLLGDLSQAQFAQKTNLSRNDIRKQIKTLREKLLRHLKSENLIASLDIQDLLQHLILFMIHKGGAP